MVSVQSEIAIYLRIKDVRSHFNCNQKKMSELLSVKYRTYQDNEKGKSIPGGAVLASYVRIGVNVNWLLTGEGPMLIEEMKNSPIAMEKMEEMQIKDIGHTTEIDPVVLSQIVVTLESKAINSNLSILKFREFILQFKQPLLWSMGENVPESTEDANKQITNMCNEFTDTWLSHAGTQAGIASYIYDKVIHIKNGTDRKNAIQKEVDFFFNIKMDQFAHQSRNPSVRTSILDPNHVSRDDFNF